MNKKETYEYLTKHNIKYEVIEHKAVFNMEDISSINLPYPQWEAKNLFVRDDKKQNYYLITVKADKRVNLKEFRKANNLRNLSFASEEDLMSLLKLKPGSVTPLGLLNDEEHKVHFYLDKDLSGNLIGIHPNDNTATIYLQANELIELIKELGNEVSIVQI